MELNELMPEREQQIIRTLLNLTDYEKVAERSGFSFALVNNIVNRRSKIIKSNKVVRDELIKRCLERVREYKKLEPQLIKLKQK